MGYKSFFLVCCYFLAQFSFAQNARLLPLKYNYGVAESNFSAISSTIIDTLKLPFFDDFAYAGPSPDARLWCDRNVYINNTFSVNQITQGMATFDHLDSNGVPYNFLSRFAVGGADTLTSQPINLFDRVKSGSLQAYALTDSIMLSFFVETGGLGDAPENDDSLKLEFKDNSGNWNQMWFINGNATADSFKQFYEVINDSMFLHNAFQFRFINVTKNSGNMNHFHLDYIQFNEDRNLFEDYTEIAFSTNPSSIFSTYRTLPYSHFITDATTQLNSNREVVIRNNLNSSVFVSLNTNTTDENATLLYSSTFLDRNDNIVPNSSFKFFYPAINNAGILNKDSQKIKSVFTIDPGVSDDDKTEEDYTDSKNNNSFEIFDYFHQYYAYDDGSAEAGFGLDYGGLPDGPAFCAMEFNNLKQDSLHGVDIHFNRALEEVGNRPITLMIWQDIAANGGSDVVIRQIQASPTYVNEKNGFARFDLDTNIVLPAGKFYIGWRQNSAFIVNVGWDKNYSGSASKVYYNFTGSWVQLGAGFDGTLMMRPLIGKKLTKAVSVHKPEYLSDYKFNLYPNPSNGKVNITASSSSTYQIINLNGAVVQQGSLTEGLNAVKIEVKGMYVCLFTTNNGTLIESKKIIIK